ncbi:MAG: hypothetical protein E7675_08040 [Ruminococcaceae bacterium]|nr:hypothetical protein [Oscillospiraceae bacterium]
MITTNIKSFESEEIERELIYSSEKRFMDQMEEAVKKVVASGNRIIFLSGPSCSGKTTGGRILCNEFEEKGRRVKEISIDDFFYGREESERIAREKGTAVDLESAAAIDLECLRRVGEDILSLRHARIPKFDFTISSRSGYEEWQCTEDTVVIFEGIQAIYPEVLEIFKNVESTSLYIYPSTPVSAVGEVFLPDEMRFFRRLVRDERSRNAPPEKTFMLWEGVRGNEEKNIFPHVHKVDITIDSSFAYEPYMIKQKAVELLMRVAKDSPYKEKADKMIEKFKNIPPMSSRFLPEDSLFREFIGR